MLISLCVLLFAQTVLAEAICVTADKARLRNKPNSDAGVTWVVGQFMPLKKIGQQGAWTQVEDLDGDHHWIESKAVSSKIECVVIKSKFATLRTKPNSKSPVGEIAVVDKYTPFKKINREEAWVQVEDDFKATYWVYETNLWKPVKRSRIQF